MMHSNIVHAEDYTTDDKTPDQIKPFIEKGMRAIVTESADLDGNGLKDYVFILETEHDKTNDHEQTGRQRVLLILVRRSDGALEVAKRNDKIVYCSTCGGAAIGDSFEGVSIGPKTFTVHAHGGSAWRWVTTYKFDYSRIDQTWQLVEATESSFHAGDPEATFKTKVYVSPNDYGKVDIADFDPENYRAQDTCSGVMADGGEGEISLATVKGGPPSYPFTSPLTP